LESAVPEGTKVLFIENVGNLVCPVAFDLGESEKIALLSTPEGEEKPLKYPGLFTAAGVVLLTKTDIAEVLEWDKELCIRNIRSVNPDAEILEISSKKGAGLSEWIDCLKRLINKKY
jgi:hydrogenase nickel incorporation protein HypB